MRICYQEMFYSRSRSVSSFDLPSARVIGNYWCSFHTNLVCSTPFSLDRKSFINVFSSLKKSSEKQSAVKELINIKAKDDVVRDFSATGILERVNKQNRFVDNEKLRAYLQSINPDNVVDISETHTNIRLKEIAGNKETKTRRRTRRKTTSVCPPLMSPDEMIHSQIDELYTKIDHFNTSIISIVKSSSRLLENLQSLQANAASSEIINRTRKQWEEQNLQKENILKKLKLLEEEVFRKEKELKS